MADTTSSKKSKPASFTPLSPAWSDISMSLPIEIATLISISDPGRARPPSTVPIKQLEVFQPHIVAARITLPIEMARLSGESIKAFGIHPLTAVESQTDIQPEPIVGNSTSQNASPTLPEDKERKFSNASSSTASIDLDKISTYKFGEGESDIYTVDDQESEAGPQTPATSDGTFAPVTKQETHATNAAELSMRADLILANAKKRLNLMDQNLRGARALTSENLQRAASMNAHRSPYTSRYLSTGDNGEKENESTGMSTIEDIEHGSSKESPARVYGHTRSGRPNQSLLDRSRMYEVLARRPLRTTRSQELPRSSGDMHAPKSPNLASVQRGPSTPRSATDTRHIRTTSATTAGELKDQMQSLNQKISLLRDQAKEDTLRRQSMQSSQPASPFTDAGQSPTGSPGDVMRQSPMALAAWADAPNAAGPPSPHAAVHEPKHILVVDRAQRTTKDWSPISPKKMQMPSSDAEGPALPAINPSIVTKVPTETDAVSEVQGFSAGPRHEDREDAFDYEHFFLHSSLGRVAGTTIDGSSNASDDTARGPAADSDFDANTVDETPEKLVMIERGLIKRFSSFDSAASSSSFATAMSALRSRQVSPHKQFETKEPTSPVKKLYESRSMDSGVTMLGKRIDDHQRHTSGEVADQVSRIAAPPATIAVAALATKASSSLSLRDKALVHMLMDSARVACERLVDPATPADEVRQIRSRLQKATKVLEGMED